VTEQQSAAAPQVNAPPSPWKLLLPVACMVAGILLFQFAAAHERRTEAGQTWSKAVIAPDAEPLWDGTVPVRARHVSLEAILAQSPTLRVFLEGLQKEEDGAEIVSTMGADRTEAVFMFALPEELWPELLAEGRAPVPGEPEVVAGNLARVETFDLDGQEFDVVGRFRPTVAGVTFAYVLPEHEAFAGLFDEESDGTLGWMAPEGRQRLTEDESIDLTRIEAKLYGAAQNTTTIQWLSLIALFLVNTGWAWFQCACMLRLGEWGVPVFGALARPMQTYRHTLIGVHLAVYGVMYLIIAVAYASPVTQFFLKQFVVELFTSGGMETVGAAYSSGNIAAAAWATYYHNFIFATVLLTLLPSLIVPPAGLIKTLLSTLLVGFAIAPMWSGDADGLSFHCITIAVEMEQYVLASWLMLVYPMLLWRVYQSPARLQALAHAGRVMGAGVLVIGILLGLAAVYEAVTLITFAG
jgi:hypothetical protein